MFASEITPAKSNARSVWFFSVYHATCRFCRKSFSQINADISFTNRAYSFPDERLLHDRRSGSYNFASINSIDIAE